MLSIGEFSKICQVSTKTLRYYAEIGLILPDEINLENGYRYYSIDQLETMLFINRLKSYNFSLEEIKEILEKKKEIDLKIQNYQNSLAQLHEDITTLQQGKSIMSYLDKIDVQLVEIPPMNLLNIRKMIQEDEFAEAYSNSFGQLFREIMTDKLTVTAPPMVLFHSSEFTLQGLDTEFAIPVQETNNRTREFVPGTCLKTVVHGSYSNLSSIYIKQCEWAEKIGYKNDAPLYEVYVNDPSQVTSDKELITEVYYPVSKLKV